MSEDRIGKIEFGPLDSAAMRQQRREIVEQAIAHDIQLVAKLKQEIERLTKEKEVSDTRYEMLLNQHAIALDKIRSLEGALTALQVGPSFC